MKTGFCLNIGLSIALCGSITWAADPVPTSRPFDPLATGELPQYVFFNKAPTRPGPLQWLQAKPESYSATSLEEIVSTVGTTGNNHLRIGAHAIFSLLETKPAVLARSVQHLLAAVMETDVPILITIDGQNWWESRPDLWNWWDPTLDGFNPMNRLNVEWTGWAPKHAVKIGWRNWGQQMRVRPAPNIAAPRILAEHWKAYDVLIPIIARWHRNLPAEKKYLFGGLKLGWEASINVNAYYYPDGNRVFEQSPTDASHDPTGHSTLHGWTFGQQPLGYAAVFTSGIKTSGELTKNDIEQVVFQYLERLCRKANRRGIPRHMVFTHQGGTYAPWDQHMSFKPAINGYSIPGWSFYSHDPVDCGSLATDMESAGRHQWAASEWWRGANSREQWRERFKATLSFKRCRFICVYNWHPFCDTPAALEAIRDIARLAKEHPFYDHP